MAMKLYSWNVNGIRAVIRKDELAPFLDKHKPDVLCLQETKAEKGQVDVDFPDYIEYWNSADKKGYSGTAIFTKAKPISVINGMPGVEDKHDLSDKYGDASTEGRVLTAEYDKFFLITVYTPNAKDDLTRLDLRQRWDKAFLEFVGRLEKKKPVVFCGDLNVAHKEIDLARPKENDGKKGFTKEEREGIQNYIDKGYLDTFRMFTKEGGHYSWWTHWANARARNVGWRIDYFLASKKLKSNVKDAKIHGDVMGSDHAPISLVLNG